MSSLGRIHVFPRYLLEHFPVRSMFSASDSFRKFGRSSDQFLCSSILFCCSMRSADGCPVLVGTFEFLFRKHNRWLTKNLQTTACWSEMLPGQPLESTTRKRKSFCSSVSVNFLIHLFPTALFNTELVLSESDKVENVMNQSLKTMWIPWLWWWPINEERKKEYAYSHTVNQPLFL